jgi:hypothetical protein
MTDSVVDQSALAAFNGEPAEPAAAPPPKLPPVDGADPEAPFGRKPDGTPRRSRPGPGRGNRKDPADEPRTTSTPPPPPPPAPPAAKSEPRDYTADLQGAGTAVWVGLSSTPWTKAHAWLWRSQIGGLAAGLNEGAQHNAAVRRYVEKIAGEGSVLWVLPVATSVASLAVGSWQLLQDKQLREKLGAVNDEAFGEFVMEQAKAMGLDTTEPAAGSSSSPPTAQAA